MRKKKIRIEEAKTLPNIFTNEEAFKGFLKKIDIDTVTKYQDIILELGCGKGEYTIELAKRYPQSIFIGVDVKLDRIWHGATTAIANKLNNVIFINSNIENIEKFFKDIKVSEIWITFPDPQPQSKREKHRLTNPRFLEIYKKFLKKACPRENGDGVIHLKTDHIGLFEYTLGVLKSLKIEPLKVIRDIHSEGAIIDDEILFVETKYEKVHRALGDKINYLSFHLT